MNLKTQRRIASSLLKAGERRVWFDPEEIESIAEAVTRRDVQRLIHDGTIQARPERGISSFRTKKNRAQKAKGRKRGQGKRSGTRNARLSRKRRWISTIRSLRKRLADLRQEGAIDSQTYRRLYRMARGGMFKSKSHLETYLGGKR
jgi:large subunit ribosomal protein L19e